MLDNLIGGHGHGYGHKDHRGSRYGFQEHKEFMSHEESERGYFDRQARYDHHMRLPANHGRPPMAHMPVCDEEVSDEEEFYESHRSHHTTVLPHHQQPPHLNYMPPPPVAQPHHNGKMGNGWQGQHEQAYHRGRGSQHHGGHGMQNHGGHGVQHHGRHGVEHHGGHGMQHHGGHGMKHQDRLVAPQNPPHHVYMNPIHGNSGGPAVVVKATENWRAHHKVDWGNKGL